MQEPCHAGALSRRSPVTQEPCHAGALAGLQSSPPAPLLRSSPPAPFAEQHLSRSFAHVHTLPCMQANACQSGPPQILPNEPMTYPGNLFF